MKVYILCLPLLLFACDKNLPASVVENTDTSLSMDGNSHPTEIAIPSSELPLPETPTLSNELPPKEVVQIGSSESESALHYEQLAKEIFSLIIEREENIDKVIQFNVEEGVISSEVLAILSAQLEAIEAQNQQFIGQLSTMPSTDILAQHMALMRVVESHNGVLHKLGDYLLALYNYADISLIEQNLSSRIIAKELADIAAPTNESWLGYIKSHPFTQN